MKKRILLFVLVMSIVLSLVCVMVACGNNGGGNDPDNTSEGGNGNDSTASFDYQASVVNTQLETMRQGNGYLIKYNVGALENTEATQITLGAKGDVYYVADGGHENYYDVSNADHMDWYEKNGADAEWEKTTTAYSEYYTREQALDAMRAYIAAYSSWMTYYQSFVSSMSEATKTSATVAGRSCDKFSFSAAVLAGEGLNMVRASYSCYVDKSTSICLKWEYSVTVDGTTESWTLECVEFNTNPTITLPSVSGGNIGGDDNQGGNNNQGGNDTTVLSKVLPTAESIIANIGTNFKVSAQAASEEYVTTVASDGTYYYANAPTETFQKQIGELYYPYGDLRGGAYHRMGTPNYYPEDSLGTFLARGNVGNILQFAGETLSYNTEEAVTFLGRSAKKYTLEGQNLYGYDVLFHLEVTIDDLTGACLKCDWYGRAGAGFTGSTFNKASFEVTEFEYGYDNRATRVFIASIVDKIDVYEWDTEFLEQAGLSGVDAPDGDLFYSEWYYDSTRDADNAEWEAQYKLYSTTADEKLAEVNALMQAFYNAGASLNYDQEQTEYSELSWDDGDGSVGFTGYTQGYQICLYCDYISSAANPYWRITVNVVLVDRD